MTQNFTTVMSEKTDDELIKIITLLREDYQPEAVIVAEKELKTRKVDLSKIEKVKLVLTEKETKRKEFDSRMVSSGIRLAHFVVDSIGYLIVALILSFVIELLAVRQEPLTIHLPSYGILILAFFLYFVVMEYKFQKTVAKFLTKTKVVMNDGSKPELNEVFLRTACRLIPFDTVSYLFTRNGFHDRLSNTNVIKEENS
ncbi:MAG: RDD family protein [Bacteroidales bacterium]|nr:RDD family protein [Bacteroidales bacterium]